MLDRLDGYDPERGVKVVGHRGYFLRKWGVFLNQAIINYGLEFLNDREYVPLQTPQLMLRDQMAKTAQLSEYACLDIFDRLTLTPGPGSMRNCTRLLETRPTSTSLR